jgi:nitroreductase
MADPSVSQFLQKRRSVLARNMVEPGPDADALDTILSIGVRVPDHAKLAPWRLIVLKGDDRAELGAVAAQAVNAKNGQDEAAMHATESQQFMRAPCVIAVLATPVEHPKIPAIEQILSAGAVCMNVLIAAQSMGFAAQWLTGPAAYEPSVLSRLGGRVGDQVAGFIYLGSVGEIPSERARPALSDIACFGLPEVSA